MQPPLNGAGKVIVINLLNRLFRGVHVTKNPAYLKNSPLFIQIFCLFFSFLPLCSVSFSYMRYFPWIWVKGLSFNGKSGEREAGLSHKRLKPVDSSDRDIRQALSLCA